MLQRPNGKGFPLTAKPPTPCPFWSALLLTLSLPQGTDILCGRLLCFVRQLELLFLVSTYVLGSAVFAPWARERSKIVT